MDEFANKNWLRDSRQISAKTVFEPNDGNIGEIYSIIVQGNNANNLFVQNYGLPVDSYGNITLYRKGVYDSGITTYNRTKKIGYFDGEDASISLTKERLASMYSDGRYNISYSSKYITDKDGYVINPETGKKSNVVFTINIDPNSPNLIRFFEIVGSQSKGEFPTEFNISFYDPQVGYLATSQFDIVGNTANPCIVDFGKYISINSGTITLRISRWSKPFSSVKIDYMNIKTMFDISSEDLLLKYEYDNKVKMDNIYNYGCKYSTARVEFYTPEISYGRIIKYKDKTDGTTETFKVGKVMNIVDLLTELESFSTKVSFYIKNEWDIRYTYNGSFYVNRVDFNTQSYVVSVDADDICYQLQELRFTGYEFKQLIDDAAGDYISLFQVLTLIKSVMNSNYQIKISWDDSLDYVLKNIKLMSVVYNSENIWNYFDKISQLAHFYVVADTNNENNDIIIVGEV